MSAAAAVCVREVNDVCVVLVLWCVVTGLCFVLICVLFYIVMGCGDAVLRSAVLCVPAPGCVDAVLRSAVLCVPAPGCVDAVLRSAVLCVPAPGCVDAVLRSAVLCVPAPGCVGDSLVLLCCVFQPQVSDRRMNGGVFNVCSAPGFI